MAKPSTKSREIESFLENIFCRTSAITTNKCIPKPIGCGGDASRFWDALSEKEYTISGLCQNCQDSIFGCSASELGEIK
jgi:hypothetical protein